MQTKFLFFIILNLSTFQLIFGQSQVKLTEFSHEYKTHINNLKCETYVTGSYFPEMYHHNKLVSLKIQKVGYYYHPSIFRIKVVQNNKHSFERTTTPYLNCDDIIEIKNSTEENIIQVKSKLATYLKAYYIKGMDTCETSIVEKMTAEIGNGYILKAEKERSTSRTLGKCPPLLENQSER